MIVSSVGIHEKHVVASIPGVPRNDYRVGVYVINDCRSRKYASQLEIAAAPPPSTGHKLKDRPKR